jgi:hypothetical protein
MTNDTYGSFYLFFANMSQLNGHKGLLGFAIREIDSEILEKINCTEKTINTLNFFMTPQSISNGTKNASFLSDFSMRVFTSGCYYMDVKSGKWMSYGMEVLETTNITHTHCVSNHLTSFAGGWMVLPPQINFEYVLANASFLKNPTIYITVIVLVCLYILLAIWSRWMDRKDEQKVGITILNEEDNFENKYIYEIIFFTGARKDAVTDSKVDCIISSDITETEIIELRDKKRKMFRRGGIDSFIYGAEQ